MAWALPHDTCHPETPFCPLRLHVFCSHRAGQGLGLLPVPPLRVNSSSVQASLAPEDVHLVTSWEGHKFCYLHLITWYYSKVEHICSRRNDSGLKSGDVEVI